MLNFEIKVMDHASAFEYVYDRAGSETVHVHPFAILSIQEYKNDRMGVQFIPGGNLKDALNIHFSDIETDAKTRYPEVKLMTEEDARKIKEFVEGLIRKNEIDKLLIHCYAGASRSPAVAAAIARVYNGDDREYFKKYTPNMHVYKMILKTYGYENDGSAFSNANDFE